MVAHQLLHIDLHDINSEDNCWCASCQNRTLYREGYLWLCIPDPCERLMLNPCMANVGCLLHVLFCGACSYEVILKNKDTKGQLMSLQQTLRQEIHAKIGAQTAEESAKRKVHPICSP